MQRVPCSICKNSFTTVSALNLHYKVQHRNEKKTFLCKVDSCPNRKFDVWDSYKKHLLLYHKVPLNAESLGSFCERCESAPVPSESEHPVDQVACDTSSNSQESEIQNVGNQVDGNENPKNPDDLSGDLFYSLLSTNADRFICKLYSKPGLPRNHVGEVINDVSAFLESGFVNFLKEKVLRTLTNLNADKTTISDLSSMFDAFGDPFGELSTEYRRLEHFKSLGDYIPPESYIIHSRLERYKARNGAMKARMKHVTGQRIPLAKVYKKFLELPNALQDIQNYMRSLENCDQGCLSNMIQAEIWKQKRSKYSADAIVLPLNVYFDEFEPNNPLGPHSEKLGAVYTFLACLPPECQAKLENRILALLFDADDRKSYGNAKTFDPLIQELKLLESEGITVSTPEGEKKVYLVTGFVLGDNLGVHGMCGYVESFVANFPCRLCKAKKCETETMTVENCALLRTNEDYERDVSLNDPSRTGIKERCSYHDLDACDVMTTVAVDWMHDGAEGVAHYTMIPVLRHFRSKDALFLNVLNYRMFMADLGPDSTNRPPSITAESLEKGSKLKMTASEMTVFVKFFGVLIYDRVDTSSPYWQLYSLLQRIFLIIGPKVLPCNISGVLAVLIKDHHELYLSLTKETLKPKHHFMIHYPRILQLAGPISHLSSIRFEAKHKVLKTYTNVTTSRQNLPLSVAIKQQLSNCYRFQLNESIIPCMNVGPGDVVDLTYFEQFYSFRRTLPEKFRIDSEYFSPRWVNFKGTQYEQRSTVFSHCDDILCPVFAEIQLILLENGEPLFICSELTVLGYHDVSNSFEVERKDPKWYCVKVSELQDPFPVSVYQSSAGCLLVLAPFLL